MRILGLPRVPLVSSTPALGIAFLVALLASGGGAGATTYVWPIGNGSTPDETNTSFGPRINFSQWDFHDGVDLPGACGTDLHAVADGTVTSAGPASPPTWSSRHVVIRVADDDDGDVYVYYLHLQSIDAQITPGATVNRGQVIGKLGNDAASYCHLHIEFRRGNTQQASSVHPLHYLPYTDTANFTAPGEARFNRQADGRMAARLLFGAASKLEGDLAKVEVELYDGATLLETRRVELDDKTTINEGLGDGLAFVGDIAVEGYQSSNMGADGRTDLSYGVVVRNLPADCDRLVARVVDLGNHTATSAVTPVPDQTATELTLDFEDGQSPPAGWTAATSTNGSGTSIANDATTAKNGSRSLLSTDASSSEGGSQRAGIEHALPAGRFEWRAEGFLRPASFEFPADGKQVYLLHFLDQGGANLSATARLRRTSGKIWAGIAASRPDGTTTGKDSGEEIAPGSWRRWSLHLVRVGTRETTGILSLDGTVVERLTWDSTGSEPRTIRLGVGQSFSKVKITLNADDAVVTERTM